MYYTQDQVLSGITEYIKHEVLPEMPGYAKVLAGAALLHNMNRLQEVVNDLSEGSTLKTIDVVSDNGHVEVDNWCRDLKQSLHEFCGDKVEVKLPGLAPMIFRADDIDRLRNYMT